MTTPHETPKAAARRLSAGAIRKGFIPEALHPYTDSAGNALYWRIRAKNPATGDKWIRPMKLDGMAYVLGEPAPDAHPHGKPLYRLHELSARTGDVVIVTEGEQKADKLAELGLLVTTSGAADSAGKADWQPLAGRDVLIWPDNDDAGERYGAAVTAALVALGCTARMVDVAALGLDAKGDAADWLTAHPKAAAADVLALACQSPEIDVHSEEDTAPAHAPSLPAKNAATGLDSPGLAPNTCRYGGGRFTLSESGVSFTGVDSDGNEKAPVWVCSPIGVIAKTRDAKSGEWGRLLEWFDDDGVRHQWPMPLELLEGDGVDVRRELARLGLHIATSKSARDLLAAYIKVWPVNMRARCVERLGWHGNVYATPSETIGEAGELVVFQNAHAIEPALTVAGTVDAWRDSVAALAAGNTRLVFALSVAFAGTLADIVGEDSGGFHYRGKSSSGKSTALKAAASVWGAPAAYVRVWRATSNGLEGLAALHNDGLLILDELSQCDPREAGESAYLLANGQGKARAARNGTARASQRWRLLFLSAGEESLSALMARVGRKANAGQEIRLADFDADAGAGMGAFEQLHGEPTAASLALAVKDAAARSHGAVGLAWLRRVVADRVRLADFIADGVKQFVHEVVPRGAAGQVERVARRFALVAVAGELATHYGLTAWAAGESERAAKACFASWLDGFGGIGNREERAVLAQVRAFLEAHGASRFEDMAATSDQRIVNRAGFYRARPDGVREYLVLPEAFKTEVCKGLDTKAAETLLVAKGWIEPGGDGRPTQKPRLPGIGTTARVYVFTGKVWEGDE
jgi:putative DNA primase/helicase